LSQRVPAFVEKVLESRHKLERGFTLADATRVVATIEQLIYDFEGSLLEKVYKEQRRQTSQPLDRRALERLLDSYMLHWMVGEDERGIAILLGNRSLLETAIPNWREIVSFANGHARAFDYHRQVTGQKALALRYSFEDVHEIVGGISKSFASFWESECSTMKSLLDDMDKHHTGRVPLAKFYGTALDTEWRFGESEEYLRELGALDETSWRGKQVIISNYIQAASNCIVASKHYLVCCANECEGRLEELETRIGAPTAEPIQILAVVANMSGQTTLDDDFPPPLETSLKAQLDEIAASRGGKVPLHGRLFAQWLHFVFPRECPFPHKVGTAKSSTPLEFGESFIASETDMMTHAQGANATELPSTMEKEELQWMSQWSAEEELIADYTAHGLRAPWETRGLALGGGVLFLLASALGVVGLNRKVGSKAGLLPYHGKSHFV